MNEIANAGSDQGNFIYVETQNNDFHQKITDALGDSFDIAMGSDSAVKFRVENAQEDYKEIKPAEISYVAVEKIEGDNQEERKDGNNEEEKDDEEMDEPEVAVLVTVQQIQKTKLVNELLTITMVTKSSEYDCKVKVETT